MAANIATVDLVKIPVNAANSPAADRLVKLGDRRIAGVGSLVVAPDGEFMITRIDPRTGRLVLKSTDGEWAGPRLVARSPQTVKAVVQFGKVAKAGAKALERIKAREAYRAAKEAFAAAQNV